MTSRNNGGTSHSLDSAFQDVKEAQELETAKSYEAAYEKYMEAAKTFLNAGTRASVVVSAAISAIENLHEPFSTPRTYSVSVG